MEMLGPFWEALVKNIGPLASLLLLGNMFFVYKLYQKIDEIASKLPLQDGQLTSMAKDIVMMNSSITQINAKLEDIGHLRERVAVLEDRSQRP